MKSLTFKGKRIADNFTEDIDLSKCMVIRKNNSSGTKPKIKPFVEEAIDPSQLDMSDFRLILRNEKEIIPDSSFNTIIKKGSEGKDGFSGYSGFSGKNGKDGYSGFSGKNGKDGLTPRDGLNGSSGFSGLNGKPGSKGKDGSSGWSGYSGFSGGKGLTGFSGAIGKSGWSGTSGWSGFSGTSGWSGYSGTSGISGTSGWSGYSGTSGISGWSGYSGYSGLSGMSGLNGTSGFSGVSGGTGKDGFSGFSGWSGKNGKPGKNGLDAKDGLSGFSGKNGKPGKDGVSGFSGFSGLQGDIGPLPKHEFDVNGFLRFEISPNVWGQWFDLNTLVKKLKLPKGKTEVRTEFLGGGGSNLDFIYKGQLFKDPKYITIDDTTLILRYDTLGRTILETVPNSATSTYFFTQEFTKLNEDDIFWLSYIPLNYSEHVYINRVIQYQFEDYKITEDNNLQILAPLNIGDRILIKYATETRIATVYFWYDEIGNPIITEDNFYISF